MFCGRRERRVQGLYPLALSEYADELEGVVSDYQEQFQVGRQELLNILDVQSEYYTAKSRLLDAKFDSDTAVYRILGVQGLATERILGPDGCKECFGADKSTVPGKDNNGSLRRC